MTTMRFPRSLIRQAAQCNYTLEEGLRIRDKYGGFRLPPYQRQKVWDVDQQVRFLESLLLGYPVGTYCVHEDLSRTVKWELLDGLQRWAAIFAFVDDGFAVFGLKYSELTVVEHRVFRGTLFPMYKVQNYTDDEKFELFQRLAYGGTPNNPEDARTTETRLT